MRFAHFLHNLLHYCAAKPRKHPGEKAKPLRIKHTLRAVLLNVYQQQKGAYRLK